MMRVERLELDARALDEYLAATPDTAQHVAKRLAQGTAPRTLVLEGACDPTLLEDLACDLAARGLVTGAFGAAGEDLLAPMTTHFARHADARTAYAPKTPTPMPVPAVVDEAVGPAAAACIADEAPLCVSPLPGATSSIEDVIASTNADASPVPADLTPSKSALVALAEPTVVDDTVYGASEPSEAAPAVETPDARPVPLVSDVDEIDALLAAAPAADGASPADVAEAARDRSTLTPLASVTEATADETSTTTPREPRRLWPVMVFLLAAATIAWAFLRSNLGHGTVSVSGTRGTVEAHAPASESPLFAPELHQPEVAPAPASVAAQAVVATAMPKPAAPTSNAKPAVVTTPSAPAVAIDDERDCTTATHGSRAAHARP
jgi:hypothetical protein